jgi:hypothetical protein
MMCQEVIELMQRYLDQDLNEIEYKQMLSHLQDCPECTELFQRLVSLSEHLENLPKVTPAFSLVDALLPRLQHIDMDPAAVDYGVAALSATDTAGQMEPLAAKKKDALAVTRLSGWRSKTRGWISARIVGGVVAAGLVFGFFIFDQQKPSNMQNADVAIMAPTSAAQSRAANKEQAQVNGDDASAKDAGSSELKAPAAAAPAVESNTPAAPAIDSKIVPSPKEIAVPPSTIPIKPSVKPTAPAATLNMGSKKIGGSLPEAGTATSGTAADSAIPPVLEQLNSNSQKMASPVPATGSGQLREPATFGGGQSAAAKSDATSNTAPAPTPAPISSLTAPAPTAPNGGSGGGATAPVTDSSAGAAAAGASKERVTPPVSPTEGFTDNNKLKADSGALVDPISPMMVSDTQSMVSLDKQYTGSVIEKRVVIKDKGGQTIYTSPRAVTDSDKVTLLEWTSDSKLVYQVTRQGDTKSYVINAINWTETNK